MKTKNIFKTLALVMMIPAMLLTTACSNDDDAINEKVSQEGYKMPITVNVTRQGDEATTRATYNETTKKLSFSTGDQLFVEGTTSSYQYADTLTWTSGGTFSGNLSVNGVYPGTVEEMLTNASSIKATLLPSGSETYRFLSIDGSGYGASLDDLDYSITVVSDLATAVEQFSLEQANSYNDGFNLTPQNAIVNCTLKVPGTNSSTKSKPYIFDIANYVKYGGGVEINFDDDSKIKFVIAVASGYSKWALQDDNGSFSDIDLSYKSLYGDRIYNINRNPILASVTTEDKGKVIGANGNIYVNVAAAEAANTTAVAMIAYVGSATGAAAPYNHGLALALSDEGKTNWRSAKDACENHTPAIPGGKWKLATQDEWATMMVAAGEDDNLRDGFISVGGTNMLSDIYWSSTVDPNQISWVFCWDFKDGDWGVVNKFSDVYVRACLAF